ncbi:MAG: HAMP domain-containing sensor histidine kinase [Tepidisphaeraceae bacterium]
MRFILAATAVTVVGSLLVGVHVYRRVSRPLENVRQAARAMAAGDRQARAASDGDTEFRELAGDFNRMADRLTALCGAIEAELDLTRSGRDRAERLAQLGLLAAGALHEIASPLSLVACTAERLEHRGRATLDDSTQAALVSVREEALRCQAIARSLLDLARPAGKSAAVVSVGATVRWVVQRALLLHPPTERMRVKVAVRSDAGVAFDEVLLRQVLMNLLSNAFVAVRSEGGTVRIEAADVGTHCVLNVIDDGRGVNAAQVKELFEPLSDAASGHGLGLFISRRIVEQAGGTLTLASAGEGRGAVACLRLPKT